MKKKLIITESQYKKLLENEAIKESVGDSPIKKFAFFSYNYPHNFISDIWGDGTVMAQHLKSKFETTYSKEGSKGVMTAFYIMLDEGNRRMLEDYILNGINNRG